MIRDGGLAWFHGHGVADVASKKPITEDTVFRIASITKTFTAIAVMQLWEQGLVDLDAPANDYLRTFRLVPAKPSLPAGHRAAPPHAYRRNRLLAAVLGPASAGRRFGRPGGTIGRAPRLRTTTAGACRWRWSRGPSGCTATTGSPRSGRSSRT